MNGDREKWRDRAGWALRTWRADLSDGRRAGDLAALGRLSQPLDAMMLPCFAELCNLVLDRDDRTTRRIEVLARCALLAGRLSGFEEGASLAAAMAQPQGAGRPLVSAVRASALFSLEDEDQACMAVASLLGTLGGRASARLDAMEVVRVMSDWERARRDLALRYYRTNAPQGPSDEDAASGAQRSPADAEPTTDLGRPD